MGIPVEPSQVRQACYSSCLSSMRIGSLSTPRTVHDSRHSLSRRCSSPPIGIGRVPLKTMEITSERNCTRRASRGALLHAPSGREAIISAGPHDLSLALADMDSRCGSRSDLFLFPVAFTFCSRVRLLRPAPIFPHRSDSNSGPVRTLGLAAREPCSGCTHPVRVLPTSSALSIGLIPSA